MLSGIKPQANLPNTRQDESNHRARNWICTVPGHEDVDIAKLTVYADTYCKYLIAGKEVGKTGVPHLQVYMQLKKQTAGQTVKNQSKILNMWMGIANSAVKSREYCMKDGDFVEFGEFDPNTGAVSGRKSGGVKGGQQTKQMWSSLNNDINEGFTERQIKDKYPHLYFKHHSGVAKGISISNKIPRRTEKTCVHVYIGRPGCGKTSKARELGGDNAFFYNSPNKVWWSGYDGKSTVVLDDFHGNYPFEDFKKMTDKYPHQVPVHNGMINFNPEKIIITSNELPANWWRTEVLGSHGLSALIRRINVLEIYDEKDGFIPYTEYIHPTWNEGCVCDPKFAEDYPTPKIHQEEEETVIPESPPPSPKPKKDILDLAHSSFLDGSLAKKMPAVQRKAERVLHKRLELETSTVHPYAKKQKVQKDLPNKQVGALTKKMDELYGPPDPIEIESESDSDDADSIESFDSSLSMEEEGESISESF